MDHKRLSLTYVNGRGMHMILEILAWVNSSHSAKEFEILNLEILW